MNEDKNTVGLPLLPKEYRGPCRFAVDDLGWNPGIVTDYVESPDGFMITSTTTGETHYVPRRSVLREGEHLKYATLRRGKLEVTCELKYEEYDTRAAEQTKRGRIVLIVTACDEEVGKVEIAAGPRLDVKDMWDGELTLNELRRRWSW